MKFARRMLCETIVSYMLRHNLHLDLVYLVKNNNNKNLVVYTSVLILRYFWVTILFLITVKMFGVDGSVCCSYLISFMRKSLMPLSLSWNIACLVSSADYLYVFGDRGV